ncbi:MAG: hypothetical protein U9O94_00050 [Nanoarchaeota archaeon]|nr:hypothetical protein [Nanoarchaeota archaeon]
MEKTLSRKEFILNAGERALGLVGIVAGASTLGSSCSPRQREESSHTRIWGNEYKVMWRTYDWMGRETEYRERFVDLEKDPDTPINSLEYRDSPFLVIQTKYAPLSETKTEQTRYSLTNYGYEHLRRGKKFEYRKQGHYEEEKVTFNSKGEVIEVIQDINGDRKYDWREIPRWQQGEVKKVDFDLDMDGVTDTTVFERDVSSLRFKLEDNLKIKN